jgi:hypothetical protein
MSERLPWGHKSRHCIYCGKVGPRCIVAGGYAHKYCLPKELVVKDIRPDGSVKYMTKQEQTAWCKRIRTRIVDAGTTQAK